MTELKEEGTIENPEEKQEIIEDYLTDLKTTVEEIPASVTTGSIAESVAYTLEELDEVTSRSEGLQDLIPLVEGEYSDVIDVKTVENLTPTDLQRSPGRFGGHTHPPVSTIRR